MTFLLTTLSYVLTILQYQLFHLEVRYILLPKALFANGVPEKSYVIVGIQSSWLTRIFLQGNLPKKRASQGRQCNPTSTGRSKGGIRYAFHGPTRGSHPVPFCGYMKLSSFQPGRRCSSSLASIAVIRVGIDRERYSLESQTEFLVKKLYSTGRAVRILSPWV